MALRGLVPYAVAAVLIAVGSSFAVVSTARPIAGLAPTSSASVAVATARTTPELSKTARLAYWRDNKMWVSNLDGSLRRSVASIEDLRRVSLTRWAIDGSAVAFVDSGLSLAVVSTAGAYVDVDLPIELRNSGYRIADIRWSPDATRIAATLLRPGDGRSDAFLVDLTATRAAWSRLTSLEDLFVGDWISNDDLLASTALGAAGILSARRPNTMRLISGVQAVSPVVGPEGRIHFLVGRVPTSRDPSLAYITANRASVWSAALDGSDVRRETQWELNDIRLDARLPDGRYLAHRGSSGSQGVVVEDVELLPTSAGVVERVRIAPDGRTAYGFTPERIVRIDLTKLTVTPPATPAAAVSVYLDTGGEADVWFPTSLSLARGDERAQGAPAARSVFALGSHLWQLDGGVASLLRSAPVLRRTQVPAPRWSPSGDHVVVVEQAGTLSSSTTFIAYVIGRSGDAMRIAPSQAAARSFSWSPDGKELAIVVDRRGVSGIASDAEPEVRFLDPAGKVTRPAVPGREVAWTAKGVLVLRDVNGVPSLLRIEDGDRTKALTTRDTLAGDQRASTAGTLSATVSSLDASRDGTFASVRLQTQDTATSRTWLVLLDGDGKALHYVRGESLADLAWSPSKPYLGYTSATRSTSARRTSARWSSPPPRGSPSRYRTAASRDGRRTAAGTTSRA
ncbi:MAG: PD40 domain-containing protein [Chloroflexi bacterium]|nr:PD40 domain-containing protein [Chloroflexota bacterium]